MPLPLSLSALAKPRVSAFGRGRADTVAEIADLPKLDAAAFFAETHITEGMGVLLRQVFDRLMGWSDQGVFRLKHAMGGGKTHNLSARSGLSPARWGWLMTSTTSFGPSAARMSSRVGNTSSFW